MNMFGKIHVCCTYTVQPKFVLYNSFIWFGVVPFVPYV